MRRLISLVLIVILVGSAIWGRNVLSLVEFGLAFLIAVAEFRDA